MKPPRADSFYQGSLSAQVEMVPQHSEAFPHEVMTTSRKKNESAATKEVAETAEKSRTPISTLRKGDCSVSIWHRTFAVKGKLTTFFSCSFERSYRDKDQTWRNTKSFGSDDLPKIVLLCQKAETTIAELRASDGEPTAAQSVRWEGALTSSPREIRSDRWHLQISWEFKTHPNADLSLQVLAIPSQSFIAVDPSGSQALRPGCLTASSERSPLVQTPFLRALCTLFPTD